MAPNPELSELGPDQLDRPVEAVASGEWRWLPHRRLALGLRSTPIPAFLFVGLGMALGPAGINLLGPSALGEVQALVWVALAVIGVFVGLGLANRPADMVGRAYLSGALIALVTIPLLGGGLYLLLVQATAPVAGHVLAGAGLIAICASVSAALHTADTNRADLRRAAYLADLDDVPLLVAGVAVVAALAGEGVALRLAVTIAGGAAIGLTGWLLFERADPAERGLFVAGTVLCLAGTGAYLGTSPLLSGCVAALLWVAMPGPADRITARDLQWMQHPLVALLLVIAGATVEWSAVVLWLTACTVILRIAAKLLASLAVTRVSALSPGLLATVLLQPGVLGIALALNAGQLLGPDYLWVVSTVTVSVALSEMLAPFLAQTYEGAA